MCVHFMLAGTSGRNILKEPPVLTRSKSLNRNEWEEQAYQIIRRQKLRDAALRELVEKTSKVSVKKPTSPHSDKLLESSIASTLVGEVIFQLFFALTSRSSCTNEVSAAMFLHFRF